MTASKDFLSSFITYLEGTEVPEAFALWCGVAGVGCALGRRVWLDMSAFKIYPNEYIVLVAGSGRCRKSTAIRAIERLCYELDPLPNMISQKLTTEALIEAIRIVDEERKTVKSCVGYVFVDEFTNFINRRSLEQGLNDLLTPLWDCTERYEYRTRGRGTEDIRKACLGILGGTTPQSLREAIPEQMITGGLASRIVFVYSREPRQRTAKALLRDDLEKYLVSELQRMHLLKGEMTLSNEADVYYVKAYEGVGGIADEMDSCDDDDPRSGFLSRKHTHILKLGLMLSAVEGKDMVIHERHLIGAETILRTCERGHGSILRLMTTSMKGSSQQFVFNKIAKKGESGISRTELMRLISHKIDAKELSEIISTLRIAGMITVDTGTTGRGTIYFSTES